MKTLLILRHAKSSWKHVDRADHDRPLNKRGRRDAPRIGLLLRERGLRPDLIVSSTAVRAATTSALVAEAAGFDGEIELDGRIYHADPDSLVRVLAQLPGHVDRVLLVGHNPGLEMLLELLTGLPETLPTAALARLDVDIDEWTTLTGKRIANLVELWRPREMS